MITQLLSGVKENVALAPQTTWQIGGPARYFYLAESIDDLVKAVKTADRLNIPYFILGGGSNLLVDDAGFAGLVIKMGMAGAQVRGEVIVAAAGLGLDCLVKLSIDYGLTGLEWAIGIPGTVGGAVRGNVGAFGGSIGDIVKKVKIFNGREIKITTVEKLQFTYRRSIFKYSKNVILEVEIQLETGNKLKSQQLADRLLRRRAANQPLDEPSAGCVFQNPPNQSAGQLIDRCGLKNKRIGQAQVSARHANFIINLGGATAEQVLKLIKLIKQEVKKKFVIDLQEEIVFLTNRT